MGQKLNFNHNALMIEQLLQSRSNCSIVRAIGQFVHTAHCHKNNRLIMKCLCEFIDSLTFLITATLEAFLIKRSTHGFASMVSQYDVTTHHRVDLRHLVFEYHLKIREVMEVL